MVLAPILILAAKAGGAGVKVEQFGMAQCPMTSSWTHDFFESCIERGTGIKDIVNFTLNMVGGTEGGPVNSTSDTKSFHGPQEVLAEKYQLCARELEPRHGLGSYLWVNFTACMDGFKGVDICTLSSADAIERRAEKCAENRFDWQTLKMCASGEQGVSLFNNSVWFTAGEMAAKRIPPYGVFGINNATGFGIPIIRVSDEQVYKGADAYQLATLGDIICRAAGTAAPEGCGCEAKLEV